MAGPATYSLGNVSGLFLINLTLTPASVAGGTTAGSSAEQTFTCPGVRLGDFVDVSKPTTQAGLVIGNTRVSAANVLAINFGNLTSTTITPTAGEVYSVQVTRGENYNIAGVLPSGIPGS